MFIMLQPSVVAQVWPELEQAMMVALPATEKNINNMTNVLAQLLTGKMQCWVSQDDTVVDEAGNPLVHAVIITQIISSLYSHEREFFLYSLTAFGTTGRQYWKEGMDKLIAFAQANHCDSLTALTDDENILNLLKRYKGEVRNFVRLEIEDVKDENLQSIGDIL